LIWLFAFKTVSSIYRKILQTTQREYDHTIKLYTNQVLIETTAEHPFYTIDGWKDAADLRMGDKIITKNDETVEIIKTK
jgi:intein/homing endonuclease